MQRVHARMIKENLGDQLIGHLSRDSTAIDARESLAKKTKLKKKQPPKLGQPSPNTSLDGPKKAKFAQRLTQAPWSANVVKR